MIDEWKMATIIPIPKLGKELSSPTSYRPISLLSCFAKLVERLITRRLYYYVETNKLFSATQAGFRKRLGTHDQISRIENQIKVALARQQVCVIVFFDIAKAYDTVWHLGLLVKMAKLGICGKMLRWVQEYLQARTFKVFFEGSYSSSRNISSSVPQGSSSAPSLFNIMVHDMPRVAGVYRSEFADDIAIAATGSDVCQVTSRVQEQINALGDWCKRWGLDLNVGKTKAMLFHEKTYSTPGIGVE